MMATKATCRTLAKVGDDEPIFVLRAQDRLAPHMVLDWAERARGVGVPEEKCAEAERCAKAMWAWARVHGAKFPD